MIDQIKVYDLPSLIDQKLQAVNTRTTARDLYDIHFLAISYPHLFNDKQGQQLITLTSDLNSLEKRFNKAFEIDDLLRDKEFDYLLLSLQAASHSINEDKLHKATVENVSDGEFNW